MIATALHAQILSMNSGDDSRDQLMRDVWQSFPIAVDVHTGRIGCVDYQAMRAWCRAQFGREAFLGEGGEWQTGGATVNGWTWFGFKTHAQLEAFRAQFPPAAIEGIEK